MRFEKSVLAMALAIGAGPVLAAEPEALDEVLVQGALPAEPAVESGSVEELSPSGAYSDGGDLLRDLMGVSGVRMGGHGIDPIIRGQSQTRLNVLLDGAYVHGGCPNRMDPPTAYSAPESYDRITVIKGSQTVRYGGGGSGGTLLFERVTPAFKEGERFRGRVDAGYQDNSDTVELDVDIAAGSTQGYVRGLYGYKDADNYKDGQGDEVRSAYETRTGGVLLGLTPHPGTRVEFSAEATRERDTLFAGATMDSPVSDADNYRLKLERETPVGPFSGLRGELYLSEVEHLMDNYSLRTNTTLWKKTPTTSDTHGGRVSADIQGRDLLWTIGADYQLNERDATRYRGPVSSDPSISESIMWPGADLEQQGVFAEMEFNLNAVDALKGGVRYDYVQASISRGQEAWTQNQNSAALGNPLTAVALYNAVYTDGASEAEDEHNIGGFLRFERKLAGGAGLFSASLSRSVRTADATERYIASRMVMMGVDRSWVGNPNLDPEKHHQAELGLSWRGTGWDSSFAVYYNKVDDYILRDLARGQEGIIATVPSTVTVYRNVDATLAGFEWSANYRLGRDWLLGAGLAYVNAENDTDNRPIAQTPPLEGRLSLDYSRDTWALGAVLRANATQDEADLVLGSGQDAQETPGWGVVDLYGRVDITRQAGVRFGVDNLFDKTYAYHVNRANTDPFNPDAIQVNEPGRNVWARLSWKF